MNYLPIILALLFISCSSYPKFNDFSGSYHNPDYSTPSRDEVLELYITIPAGDETQRTLYLHTYWDHAAKKNVSTTGYWHMKGKDKLEFWDWQPYPGDTAISEMPHASTARGDNYPEVSAAIHFDADTKIFTIDSFAGNPKLRFIRELWPVLRD